MPDERVRRLLRELPSIEELLQAAESRGLLGEYPRERIADALRIVVEQSRDRLLRIAPAEATEELVAGESLLREAANRLKVESQPRLRRVLNASGVVIHTNLGRSRLAPSAFARVEQAALHYSNLEYDLAAGARGSRHDHVEGLLRGLTGAAGAMVVNNNAAAVLLMLAALAEGREVVVSRGQLVEIGGSFRIPDIMRLSGARLVEVGTTNKTHFSDYERSLTDDTALLLRVHTSNFKVVGFAEEVPVERLVELGRNHQVLVADDLGSGALLDLPASWKEPSVASSLQAGVDVVSFSGDKLLGGPQAGILLGTAEVIERLKRHPFARAVRVDKMTLAALEGTLLLYQDPASARREIPTLRYLERGPQETLRLAERLAELLGELGESAGIKDAAVCVRESVGKAGGGSLPLLEIPSHAVALRSGVEASRLEAALRRAPLPLIGRVTQDELWLDVLALDEEELEEVANTLVWALRQGPAEDLAGD